MTDNTITHINNTWNNFSWVIKSCIQNLRGDYLIAALHIAELFSSKYILAALNSESFTVVRIVALCNSRSEHKYLGLIEAYRDKWR